ncbi:MAG: hypothetical protein HBSAPP03_24800 [Phycisphaerae bacterium]|nr:MAG: hypothetical protein HBSAPP03_24800 [Phycisphaerae bacterium]
MTHITFLSTVAVAATLLSAFTLPPPTVLPVVETDPVPDAGDAADDPAIWVHPRDPSQSLVIGTNKRGGLAVYDLGGSQIQYLPVGEVNNVDVRDGFMLGERAVALVGASHTTGKYIRLFSIDPDTRRLTEMPDGTIVVGLPKPYGFCFYRSVKDRALYAFVSDQGGSVEQWKLDGSSGVVAATLVRTIPIASQTEGLVADDELGWLYASEEKVSIWRFPAEPGETTRGVVIDRVGKKGPVVPDAEGLAIWKGQNGQGYLLVSSQGSSTFAVYERTPPNAYLGSFSVGASASIDAVTGSDGIDVCSASLGAAYPNGMLVVQDDENPGRNQNFKFVPWEHVARALKPALRLRP